MSSFMIAFLMAAGGGTWVYTKVMKSNGGQAQPALVVAGCVALFILAIMWWLASFLS